MKPCNSTELIELVREYKKAVPFRPYEIVTTRGETLCVWNPDFVFVAPKNSWVHLSDEFDRLRQVDAAAIKAVRVIGEQQS